MYIPPESTYFFIFFPPTLETGTTGWEGRGRGTPEEPGLDKEGTVQVARITARVQVMGTAKEGAGGPIKSPSKMYHGPAHVLYIYLKLPEQDKGKARARLPVSHKSQWPGRALIKKTAQTGYDRGIGMLGSCTYRVQGGRKRAYSSSVIGGTYRFSPAFPAAACSIL